MKRALKNKPKWKPSKGYVFLKNIGRGKSFITEYGTKGIHIESSSSCAKVIIIECPFAHSEEDNRYYLGRQNWAPKTEVRRL